MEIEIAVRKFELPHQFSKRGGLAAAHALSGLRFVSEDLSWQEGSA